MVDVKKTNKLGQISRFRQMVADQKGQDLIEYALLGGFMVVAVAVVLPNTLMPQVSGIFSRILSITTTLTGS